MSLNKRLILLAAVVTGMVLGLYIASLSPRATADPGTNSYTYSHGRTVVCNNFDTGGVSWSTIKSVGNYIMSQGFDSKQAADIVTDSVNMWCPEHAVAVNTVATTVSPSTAGQSPSDPSTLVSSQASMTPVYVQEPPPGCGFTSNLPWSPCSDNPPQPGVYPGWNPGPNVGPWQTGSGGYVPCSYRNKCGPGY